ncbi:hypothetical protein BJV74DRAFT_846454 [Russula compacta]|nr:hypothetical protein BJV74DRAFT_846454 [Russula compacta]
MVNFDIFIWISLLLSDGFRLTIRCSEGVTSMALVCQELSPFLSHVERLELHRPRDQPNAMNMDPPAMAGAFPSIYCCSKFVCIHATRTTHRTCSARARRGKGYRSVA